MNVYEIDRTENIKRITSPNKTKFHVSVKLCEKNTKLKYSPNYAETHLHDNDSQVNSNSSPDKAKTNFYAENDDAEMCPFYIL